MWMGGFCLVRGEMGGFGVVLGEMGGFGVVLGSKSRKIIKNNQYNRSETATVGAREGEKISNRL
jgi:hypothetical protein